MGKLYIAYMDENGEHIYKGPYYTISPDGVGMFIGQNWMSYNVQDDCGFHKITVPKYHSITTVKY